jgi:hypothetical protein
LALDLQLVSISACSAETFPSRLRQFIWGSCVCISPAGDIRAQSDEAEY